MTTKYTFHWSITPACPAEYSITIPPFDVSAKDTAVTLIASGHSEDKQNLQEQANQAAHDLARTLSYIHGSRFEVAFQNFHILKPGGGQTVSFSLTLNVLPAVLSSSGTVEFEVRDAAGNVTDSSALQRERQRQATQLLLVNLMKRVARDPNLCDMLDHWGRYIGDSEGRLHALYDVLQVAERLYGNQQKGTKKKRNKVASALNISKSDLSDLARISNDPAVLNGRHPGRIQGPHRIATQAEVNTCERVAMAIIEKHAAKIVI